MHCLVVRKDINGYFYMKHSTAYISDALAYQWLSTVLSWKPQEMSHKHSSSPMEPESGELRECIGTEFVKCIIKNEGTEAGYA